MEARAQTTAISIALEPGESFGLLGPNGAGKTTLVKQVIGLLKPTSGRILLGPFDLVANPDAARQLCAYLPQAAVPIDAFRVREAIEIAGLIRGGSHREVRRRAGELIEALELGEWERTLGVHLSGGVRRLVGFAMTVVRPGPVVILDEPTNDVDPLRRRRLSRGYDGLGEIAGGSECATHFRVGRIARFRARRRTAAQLQDLVESVVGAVRTHYARAGQNPERPPAPIWKSAAT